MSWIVAQMFPAMMWAMLMAPVWLLAVVFAIASVVLSALRPSEGRQRGGRQTAIVAVVLGMIATTGYVVGSEGRFTLFGVLAFAAPAVAGVCGLTRRAEHPKARQGFDISPRDDG